MANNSNWAHLAETEGYGRFLSNESYDIIDFEACRDALYKDWQHAAHCMIFAKDTSLVFDLYPARAAVLMQMRFDGYVGFPGGLIDRTDVDVVTGLNRELEEELGLNLTQLQVQQSNHTVSYACQAKKLFLHFYLKEIALNDLKSVEVGILSAAEYGLETLGSLRVPCYTMHDNVRGLPVFLAQCFAGNARDELEIGLVKSGILTKAELEEARNNMLSFIKMRQFH